MIPLKRQVLHALQAYGRRGTTLPQLRHHFPKDPHVNSALQQLLQSGQAVYTGVRIGRSKQVIARQFTRYR